MADLNQPLKMEALNDLSYENEKQIRCMKISSLPNSQPAEKSIKRQMVDNNEARNGLEFMLRKINKTTAVAGNVENSFHIECKQMFQEKLRASLLQNYEAKAFLKLAKDVSYEAAEAFKNGGKSEDPSEDDNLKKRIEEIKKLYGGKGQKGQFQQNSQYYQPRPYYQQQHLQPSPQFSMQQFQQPGQVQQFPHPMQQMYGMHQSPPNLFYPRPRNRFSRPPIDKTNSTCKACSGIGHWAGDAQCPLNGFPAAAPSAPAQMYVSTTAPAQMLAPPAAAFGQMMALPSPGAPTTYGVKPPGT